ncbi:glycosyltransferase [Fuerstiella marisgermanici]|uniref:Glycosyl transferase family 2 n=1 Tax=Fuerstiella marisgermanici TaxID=1891926 RepID=A0A1P8WIY6_9PLAN|nr:glycosyltransferase [Fuerstiella marisgermanici]APZ94016.1 Glycosyl transferase family 2 [Fuerstiella marisgermanici]
MLIDRPTIDLAILTRTADDLHPQVEDAIQRQQHVDLRIHRVVGTPRPSDRSRIETIVRARNQAVRQTTGDWLMFLDDDVVLKSDCIARLHYALTCRPDFGAFAADYLGDCGHRRPSRHIAMGATLFRTAFLPRDPFRCEQNKCECLCRCLDMRRSGTRIEYLPGAKATHLNKNAVVRTTGQTPAADAASSGQSHSASAKILVAFNRRDVRAFRDQFLRTLRASGNRQEVIVVGYGLYPGENRMLCGLPGVTVIRRTQNGQLPPVRRLHDFGDIVEQLPPQTPVAWWDASDVLFQGRLDPLWQLTQDHPNQLLAVREPTRYPQNPAVENWCLSIHDPQKREQAFSLLTSNPYLNSGFGAGTASALLQYFRTANRLKHSRDLLGSTDWGDQTALNLYCHQDRSRWQEVSPTWNFCVHDRPRGSVRVTSDGRVQSSEAGSICAVHGNAKSLRKLALRP